MAERKRPVLIALISLLEMISGLLILIAGALIAAGLANDIETETVEDIAGIATILGGGLIITGLIAFTIGYGMFKGWKIMWYLGVIFNILDVAFGILSFTFITAIVSLIILYYLFRPKVKNFFRV